MKKKNAIQFVFEAVGIFLLLMTPIASSGPIGQDQNIPILEIESVLGSYRSITAKRINHRITDVKNVTWNTSVNDVVYRLLREINVDTQGIIDVMYAHDGTTEIRADIPKGFGTVKITLIAKIKA